MVRMGCPMDVASECEHPQNKVVRVATVLRRVRGGFPSCYGGREVVVGSRIWLGALVALVVALPGCNSSGDPDDQSKPSDTVAAPEVGTCWRVPADADGDADPSDWFDDSPRVPCTEPHTTETAHVLQLTEPTLAEVKERFSDCWDHVRVYLSVDENSWIPWGYGAWLPSKEQIADGASWMRCDAIFPETWDFAASGPPLTQLRQSPTTRLPICGPALANTPTRPSSRSSPATSRTSTSRPEAWQSSTTWSNTPRRLNSPLPPNDSVPTPAT